MLAVVGVWLIILLLGFWQLHAYGSRAGAAGVAPQQMARELLGQTDHEGSRLLVFAHPHCPCTRASLVELGIILELSGQDVAAEVHFVRPPGVPAGWEQTASWEAAAKLPGVRVCCDEGGSLAGRLGAETSGHAVLYDREGDLLFRGGLTRARGQSGDSSGRRAILALLDGSAACSESPVFGCPLLNSPECCSSETGACQSCR